MDGGTRLGSNNSGSLRSGCGQESGKVVHGTEEASKICRQRKKGKGKIR